VVLPDIFRVFKSLSQKQVEIKVTECFVEIQHQVRGQVLVGTVAFGETPVLVSFRDSPPGSYVGVFIICIRVKTNTVYNIEPIGQVQAGVH